MLLYACCNGRNAEDLHTEAGRVAYIAGKKLGSAPQRSRAKRRLREAARIAGAPWYGHDVLLVAKQGIAHKDFNQIVASLKRFGELLEQKPSEDLSASKQEREDETASTQAVAKRRQFCSFMVGIPQNIAIVCINTYRHVISPLLLPSCRFVPTCSEYALIALRRFGFWKGLWLAMRRVGRCNPFFKGGFDPVPEE